MNFIPQTIATTFEVTSFSEKRFIRFVTNYNVQQTSCEPLLPNFQMQLKMSPTFSLLCMPIRDVVLKKEVWERRSHIKYKRRLHQIVRFK